MTPSSVPSTSAALPSPTSDAIAALAPTGSLRAAINLGNFLLVTGSDAEGQPTGVSPDMARAVAYQLGVPIELKGYPTPGEVADGATTEEWDIGNIGAEPQRAEQIAFTEAYCEIESTYLVRADSPLQSISDVDQPGVRIASVARAAYDLWLERNLKHAELVRADSLGGSFELFMNEELDALAGLRARLTSDAQKLAGSRVLPGTFTTVQQAIGTPRGRDGSGFEFLEQFVKAAKATGLVQSFIVAHEVKGLSVAPPVG